MANNHMMGVAQLKQERTMTDTYRIRGENTSLGHQHIKYKENERYLVSHQDSSSSSNSVDSGERVCMKKVVTEETIEYDQEERCHHVTQENCYQVRIVLNMF